MTRTKLASVGFVAARNCIRQQVLDDTKSLPNCGRSQSATTCDSSYTPNSAQYYSILQRIQHDQSVLQSTTLYYTPVLLCTTKFYSVLQSPVPLCTTKQYSGSATPVLLYTTPVLLCTTRYYSKYYSVLQSATPRLLCTTSTTPVLLWTLDYKVLLQYYSVLQRILCTTKNTLYYKVPLQYYKVLLQYSSSTTPLLLWVLQSTTKYYSVLQTPRTTPAPPCTTKCYTVLYYKVLLRTKESYMTCHWHCEEQHATKNCSSQAKWHAWFSSHMKKCHWQCSEQQVSPSNLTKTPRLPRKMTRMLHASSSSHMKRHLQCVEQQVSPSNLTKIVRLPRKMTCMLDPHHIWNVIYNARSNRCHPPTSPK